MSPEYHSDEGGARDKDLLAWCNRLRKHLCLYVQVINQRMPEAIVRGERNASVKQLRLRLASVKSIQRITKVLHI